MSLKFSSSEVAKLCVMISHPVTGVENWLCLEQFCYYIFILSIPFRSSEVSVVETCFSASCLWCCWMFFPPAVCFKLSCGFGITKDLRSLCQDVPDSFWLMLKNPPTGCWHRFCFRLLNAHTYYIRTAKFQLTLFLDSCVIFCVSSIKWDQKHYAFKKGRAEKAVNMNQIGGI